LGALGLLLGTFGLAAVVLRNALERRREFALLQAVGFGRRAIAGVVLAENLWMLAAGIVLGTVTALVAILPALSVRGGSFSPRSLALLLGAVTAAGVLSSLAATRAVFRSRLLDALHSE
jgi:ABC-type antimicrobial peptide transport system permease subunit